MISSSAANCRSRRAERSLNTSYDCAVGAVSVAATTGASAAMRLFNFAGYVSTSLPSRMFICTSSSCTDASFASSAWPCAAIAAVAGDVLERAETALRRHDESRRRRPEKRATLVAAFASGVFAASKGSNRLARAIDDLERDAVRGLVFEVIEHDHAGRGILTDGRCDATAASTAGPHPDRVARLEQMCIRSH